MHREQTCTQTYGIFKKPCPSFCWGGGGVNDEVPAEFYLQIVLLIMHDAQEPLSSLEEESHQDRRQPSVICTVW